MELVELVMLARTMSQRFGVSVTVDELAPTACTKLVRSGNGQWKVEIVLPCIEDEGKYDRMVRGYLDHEIAHVRYTDWNVVGYDRPALEAALLNIIEDVRVEARMAKDYPGSRVNMRWLMRHLFDEQSARSAVQHAVDCARSRDILGSFIQSYVLYKSRASADVTLARSAALLEQAKELLCTHAGDDLRNAFGELDSLLTRHVSTTTEAAKLAMDIDNIFAAWLSSNDESIKHAALEISSELLGEDAAKSAVPFESDVSKAFQTMLNTATDVKSTACVYDAHSNPDLRGALVEVERLSENRPIITYDIAHCASQIAMLCGMFSRIIPPLLQSIQYRAARVGYHGRLSGRDLYKAGVGNGRIFSRRAERLQQAVNVGILLDTSGSTHGQISITSHVCTYALLGMLKALPKVTAFAAVYSSEGYRKLCESRDVRFSCSQAVSPGGGTPTAGAVLRVMSEFENTPDTRNILFVVTDGMPDNVFAFISAAYIARQSGFELYGIIIGRIHDDAVYKEQFGEDHVVIVDNIAELPLNMEAMMRKALLAAA